MTKLKKDIEEKMEKKYQSVLAEMEDKTLLLKKEMEDLKKKSSVIVVQQQQASVVPPHANIQQPLVSVPGIIDNDNNVHVANGAIMQRQQQNSAHVNSLSSLETTPSPNDNTSPMVIGSSFSNVIQQGQRGDIHVGSTRVAANESNVSQTRTLNDDHDPCYDLSTDDEIDFPSNRNEDEMGTEDDESNESPANRKEDEGRNESDNVQHERRDDTTNQPDTATTNNSPGGNNDVDFGGGDGAWSDAEENTNHQGNNSTDRDEEVESNNDNLCDPENNSNNDTENNASNQSNNSDNTNGYESDADSVDLVLQEDYGVFDGTLAFCCLNCR